MSFWKLFAGLCVLLWLLFPVGCGPSASDGVSMDQVKAWDAQVQARVDALQRLGVKAKVAATASLDGKVGGLSHNLEGPLSGTIMTFIDVDPQQEVAAQAPPVAAGEMVQRVEALLAIANEALEGGMFANDGERVTLELLRDWCTANLPIAKRLAEMQSARKEASTAVPDRGETRTP